MSYSGGIVIKNMLIFIFVSILSIFNYHIIKESNDYIYVDNEINIFTEIVLETPKGPYTGDLLVANQFNSIDSFNGPMTAYGPDCAGCLGYTASGYDVRDGNIYYYDETFGNIRIVAADKSLPFGTIIKISNLNVFTEPLLVIVLDRGSAIGFNKKTYFDLLYRNEAETDFFGCRQASFEILRKGF